MKRYLIQNIPYSKFHKNISYLQNLPNGNINRDLTVLNFIYFDPSHETHDVSKTFN